MNPQPRLARLSWLIVAALACSNSPTDPARNEPNNSNRAYIDAIVPHHMAATMMADEALAKSTRPEVREMAAMMKEDQSEEIAFLRATRMRLFESDSTPEPMSMQPIPAGPQFDRLWLQQMVQHHQGAIDLSLLARQAGVIKGLDSLATQTISKQRQEQQEMRNWLMAWYGGAG